MSTELPTGEDLALSGRFARLQREREDGERAFSRGVALLISAPMSLLIALGFVRWLATIAPFFIAVIYCIIAAASGIVLVGFGMIQTRQADRAIKRLDSERIPEARLLR